MTLKNEVVQIATELQLIAAEDQSFLTFFEALQIAVRIQQNRILSAAFMVTQDGTVPSALESIAMELGAARTGGTIKDAIYSLSSE